MEENQTVTASEEQESVYVMLRRRRRELHLRQDDITEACHVTTGCVMLWEAGRRRMGFSKIPRLATVLRLNAQELCARVLREYHPVFSHFLFHTAAGQAGNASPKIACLWAGPSFWNRPAPHYPDPLAVVTKRRNDSNSCAARCAKA